MSFLLAISSFLGLFQFISCTPTLYPTVRETIPCLNCYTLDPTGAPTYMSYEVLGLSITSEALRVLTVLFTLVVAAILVTYIGYVRSMYNKYGEIQVKRRKGESQINSSTHSESQLMETSNDKT